MAGILSIGWYLPEQRASVDQVAADYGLSAQAVRDFGLRSKVVAGPHDHPTTLAARATTAALAAANLTPSQIDLLIFAGTTRDRPAPWIAAFGVLQELGASSAAGFDLSGRCPGLADALWVAATLIEAGGVATVAVCCGDRFDYVMPALPGEFSLSQAIFSAGGAAAILGTQAGNEIVGRAHHTREDLSSHTTGAPVAGGACGRWITGPSTNAPTRSATPPRSLSWQSCTTTFDTPRRPTSRPSARPRGSMRSTSSLVRSWTPRARANGSPRSA
jgi:3-oxoacyl-[acyl-carrier-protein] synthase III